MKNQHLRDYLKVILNHEFETNSLGLEESIYTSKIIDIEARRIAKNKKFNEQKPNIIIRNKNSWKIIAFDDIKMALEYVDDKISNLYIAYMGTVTMPIYIENKMVEDLIGVI